MAGAKSFTVFTKFAVQNKFTGPVLAMAKGADKLTDHLHTTNAAAKEFGDGISKVGKFVGAVAIGAVAAGAAVFKLAQNSATAADDILNTSAALGISTKALQEYRYVGVQAGLTTEEMDTALKKLTINLGKESSDVEAALYQIGLTADQLKAAGPEKSLEMIANGFQGIQDPTTKAAVAVSLFGKSSVRMVNALSKGEEGIAGIRKEAQEIGYVMDGEALEAAGALDDQMDKFGATLTGFTNRLVQGALPGITKLVQDLQAGMAPGGRLSGLMEKLGKAFEFVGNMAGMAVDFLLKAYDVLEPFAPVILAIVAAFAAYKAIMTIVTIAQLALNLAMSLNPISLIVIAIAALIGIGIALVANWDKVGKFFADLWKGIVDGVMYVWNGIKWAFTQVWNFISGLLDNPIIATLGAIFLPFISIPALIVKNWSSISTFFTGLFSSLGEMISGFMSGPVMGFVNGIGAAIDGALEFLGIKAKADQAGASGGGPSAPGSQSSPGPIVASRTPLSPASSTISSSQTVRSSVDVNFNAPPPGTRIVQSRPAPGVTLNTAPAGAR